MQHGCAQRTVQPRIPSLGAGSGLHSGWARQGAARHSPFGYAYCTYTVEYTTSVVDRSLYVSREATRAREPRSEAAERALAPGWAPRCLLPRLPPCARSGRGDRAGTAGEPGHETQLTRLVDPTCDERAAEGAETYLTYMGYLRYTTQVWD